MFGFLIPKNYIEALEFDKANNNSTWYDATKAELDSIHSYEVFQKHEKAQYDKQKKVINAPPGYQKIRVHLIFAVKYDGRHKARLVADGHLTPEPVESIYLATGRSVTGCLHFVNHTPIDSYSKRQATICSI